MLILAWYDNNAPPPTANTRQVAAFGIAVAVLLSVLKFRRPLLSIKVADDTTTSVLLLHHDAAQPQHL